MSDFGVIEELWRKQFDELAAGWEDLPAGVRAHPGLKRIRLAALIISDNMGSMATKISELKAALDRTRAARPLAEWHEDNGPVLWWRFPIDEPPWCGTPNSDDWPHYHTHWTPLVVPEAP